MLLFYTKILLFYIKILLFFIPKFCFFLHKFFIFIPKFKMLIFSSARRNNRLVKRGCKDWENFWPQHPIPSSSFLSASEMGARFIQTNLEKWSFGTNRGWVYQVKPTKNDMEFLVSFISAHIIEKWALLALQQWWPDHFTFMLDNEWVIDDGATHRMAILPNQARRDLG